MSAAVITVAEWAKNERELVRVTLDEFNGRPIVDVRVWYRHAASGEQRPGRQGITMSARHLPALANAVNQALDLAVQQGSTETEEGQFG